MNICILYLNISEVFQILQNTFKYNVLDAHDQSLKLKSLHL